MFLDWKATGKTGSGRVQNGLGTARTFGSAVPGRRNTARAGSIHEFAPDVSAVIYRPCRSAMTSGAAQTKHWVLRFERRRPPFTEALMGWTGGDDPLAQVELKFPDLASAVAYAEREGLHYQVRPAQQRRGEQSRNEVRPQDALGEMLRAYLTLAWMQSQHGDCDLPAVPDLERALVNPAAVFRAPDEVLRHPALDHNCKRRILQQWAWDEYLTEVASDEAMPDTAPSRLPEVKAALAKLQATAGSVLWALSMPPGRSGRNAGLPAGP